MRHPNFGDFEFLFGGEEPDHDGQVYIRFPDEGASEEQTETDVKNMEGRLKMSLQQLKEQVLGTVSSCKKYQWQGLKKLLQELMD